MAVSDEAIIHSLMYETMKVEKKEFEGQKRSNENDIILHRQRLAREHVSQTIVQIIRETFRELIKCLLCEKLNFFCFYMYSFISTYIKFNELKLTHYFLV